MSKQLLPVKFTGLNNTQSVKEVLDSELTDCLNVFLTRLAEWKTRPGMRPLGSSAINNIDETGKPIFDRQTRFKYRQIFTTSREYLDVFAIKNKVYFYDENDNRFVLVYEAPGQEEIDIDTYLGHILLTSHGSNLVVLRRYGHNAFLLDVDNRIIRAEGNFDPSTGILDFDEQDVYEDLSGDIKAIDIDETALYSESLSTIGAKTFEVTDDGHGGTALETATTYPASDNTYPGQISIQVGYDHEDSVTILDTQPPGLSTTVIKVEDDPDFPGAFPTLTDDESKIESEVITDFRDGPNEYRNGKDGVRYLKLTSNYRQQSILKRKETENGITSGWTVDVDNGKIYTGTIKWGKQFGIFDGYHDVPEPSESGVFYQYGFPQDSGKKEFDFVSTFDNDFFGNSHELVTSGWSGKTLYVGHGRVINFSIKGNPATENAAWRVDETMGGYIYGVWVYFYTGKTALDYFLPVDVAPIFYQSPGISPIPILTESHETSEPEFGWTRDGAGDAGQGIYFNEQSLQSLKEFVGVFIRRDDLIRNVKRDPIITGDTWDPNNATKLWDADQAFGYADKIPVPGKNYRSEEKSNDTIYRCLFIDKSTIHASSRNDEQPIVNNPAWEEYAIGKVSSNGTSFEYYNETTNTWNRDASGYTLRNLDDTADSTSTTDENVKKVWAIGITYNNNGIETEAVAESDTKSNTNIEDNDNVFDLSENIANDGIVLNNGTLLKAEITVPDAYYTNDGTYDTWVERAISDNQLEFEVFKRVEFTDYPNPITDPDDYPDLDQEVVCEEITTTSIIELCPFNMWYRIKSPFTENDKKIYFNLTGTRPYLITYDSTHPANDVNLPMLGSDPLDPVMLCRFTFDIDWSNVLSILVTDEDEEDLVKIETEDYTIQFAAADLKRLRTRYHSKDNLSLSDIIDDIFLDGVSELWMAKTREIWLLYRDTITDSRSGKVLVVFDDDYRGMFHRSSIELPDATYGATTYALKSFTFIDGQRYVCLVTDVAIFLFSFRRDTQNIIECERLNGSTVTSKPIDYSLVRDVAFNMSDNVMEMYILSNDNTNPVSRVDIKYVGGDPDDPLDFVTNSSGEVIVNRDFAANELEYFFTGATAPFSRLAFTYDDAGDKKMIVADNGSGMVLSNAYKFQINGSVDLPTGYERVITDRNFGHFKEVKPINTPPAPVASAFSSGGSMNGRYIYFFVVREFDINDEAIYESYPSVYSNYITVGAGTDSVQIDQFTNPYVERNTDPAGGAKLYLYRATVTTYQRFVRLTDFYEVASDIALTRDDGTATWTIIAGTIVDSVGSNDTYGKYRGYTNFYPRCKFVEVFQNVVHTANDVRFGNNIYFSELFDPTEWNPSQVLESGAFSNDRITGLIANDGLYVSTRDTWEVMNGVGTNITKQVLNSEIGCVDGYTLQLANGMILFLSERGIFYISGYKYGPIDLKVSKITQELTAKDRLVSFYDNYNQDYRLVYDNNKILNYNTLLGQWSIYEYPGYSKIIGAFSRENKLTDINENVFIVCNREIDSTGTEVDVFRIMVEDKYCPYDALYSGTVRKINSRMITKFFDMQNPYNEDIYRRIYMDLVNSHNVSVSISVNEGEFAECIKQDKRRYYTPQVTWFNDVPLVWYRFNELYGSKLINYGTNGGYALAQRVQRNVDGKIDRTYRALPSLESEVVISDLPTLGQATIAFWIRPELATRNVVFSSGGYSFDDTLLMEPYTTADFEPWISDLTEPETEIFMHKFLADTAGNCRIYVGGTPATCYWNNTDAIGTLMAIYQGEQIGYNTTGGEVGFAVATGETWSTFSPATPNGLYTIDIPRVGVDQMHVEQNNAVL